MGSPDAEKTQKPKVENEQGDGYQEPNRLSSWTGQDQNPTN